MMNEGAVNPYAILREELSGLLGEVGFDIPTRFIVCPAGDYPAGLPDPERFGADGARIAKLMTGRGCVREAEYLGGSVYFSLTPDFYDRALRSLSLPIPAVTNFADDDTGRAAARMLMLARKPEGGCPESPSFQRTLWLALGVLDRSDPRHIRRILTLTADAVKDIGHELPPRGRREVFARAGALGRAVAALLYYGTEVIKQ